MPRLESPRVSLFNRLLDRTVLPGMLTFARPAHVVRTWCAAPFDERLDGRRVVITGATSGLGRACANMLAQRGAQLVLVGRDAAKLADTAKEIEHAHDVGLPETQRADLSLMSDVRALADRLLDDDAPIHVLINNAGALFDERALTAEGHERSLAINLMSVFLLTNRLLPRLVESGASSEPARVINVSSGGMYAQSIDLDNLLAGEGDYSGTKAYARAKRGQVILTERWAQALADQNVVVHAMHPGWADTPGIRSSLPGFYKLTRPILRTAEEGADTIVWLAAARAAAESTGGFWLDRQAHLTHVLPGTRATREERERLWDELVALTA